MGLAYYIKDDLDLAKKHFMKTERIFRELRLEGQVENALLSYNLSLILKKQKDYGKAVGLARQAYELFGKKMGDGHRWTVENRQNYEEILELIKREEEKNKEENEEEEETKEESEKEKEEENKENKEIKERIEDGH